ncbi:MAG TPA: hypothetical protein VMU12_02875 [Candidatus Paceibacterota bacterium]|nr:hypothetical protein [Candidatus Paceibacterota bacterium]
MTKTERVTRMMKRGMTSGRVIAQRTGFSLQYVYRIMWASRNPEQARASQKKWLKGLPRHRRRSMRIGLPSVDRARIANFRRHQRETKKVAKRRCQPWTAADLRFIETHATVLTVHEMAVALGRTYHALVRKAQRVRIPLGYEQKTGLNAQQFK